MITLADPCVAKVPVSDNSEPLVDLRLFPELRIDDRWAEGRPTFAMLRKDVAHRLLTAQSLLPSSLHLLVVEGHRNPSQQQSTFDGYLEILRGAHPNWDDERLFIETSKFASPVSVAPHLTGGAVDITLCDRNGELDMGTEIDATPEESKNSCFTAADNISVAARGRRRLLGDVLTEVGFVNYPSEWWHWSYGDRYWALLKGMPVAMYGPVWVSDDQRPGTQGFTMEGKK